MKNLGREKITSNINNLIFYIMNEIYWMTVVGNLSTAFMVVWIVALLVIVTMLFALLVTEGDMIEDEGGKRNFF